MFIDKYIRNQSYYVLIGNLLAAGFSMVSFMILTRLLTKQQFGLFESFMALLVLIEMVFQGLSNNALIRFLNSYTHRRKHIIGSSMLIRVCLNVLTTVLIYGFYFYFKDSIQESEFELFFIYCPVFIWSMLPVNMIRSILQSDQKFKLLAIINMGLPLSLFTFYIVGIFVSVDLMYVIYGNIIFRLILSIVVIFAYSRYISYIKYSSLYFIKKLIEFGKFSILTFLGSNLLKSADKILIQYFIGASSVAIWSVPLKLTELIDNPVRSAASTSYPKMTQMFSNDNHKELSDYIQKMIAKYIIISIPLALVLITFPSFFIKFVAGAGYGSSVIILQIFSIYVLLVPFDRFIGTALSAVNKPQYDSIKMSIMAIVNIVGDIIVLMIFDSLWPVAVVTLINLSVGILIGIVLLQKQLASFSIKSLILQSIPLAIKELNTIIKLKYHEFFIKI